MKRRAAVDARDGRAAASAQMLRDLQALQRLVAVFAYEEHHLAAIGVQLQLRAALFVLRVGGVQLQLNRCARSKRMQGERVAANASLSAMCLGNRCGSDACDVCNCEWSSDAAAQVTITAEPGCTHGRQKRKGKKPASGM